MGGRHTKKVAFRWLATIHFFWWTLRESEDEMACFGWRVAFSSVLPMPDDNQATPIAPHRQNRGGGWGERERFVRSTCGSSAVQRKSSSNIGEETCAPPPGQKPRQAEAERSEAKPNKRTQRVVLERRCALVLIKAVGAPARLHEISPPVGGQCSGAAGRRGLPARD